MPTRVITSSGLPTAQEFDVEEAVKLAVDLTKELRRLEKVPYEVLESYGTHKIDGYLSIAADLSREISPRIENGKISSLDKIKLRIALLELEMAMSDLKSRV